MSPTLTPSCPAASATPAISVADAGSSFAIPRSPACSDAICASVPSTVFVTPVQADSQSIAALPVRASTPAIASPDFREADATVAAAAWLVREAAVMPDMAALVEATMAPILAW